MENHPTFDLEDARDFVQYTYPEIDSADIDNYLDLQMEFWVFYGLIQSSEDNDGTSHPAYPSEMSTWERWYEEGISDEEEVEFVCLLSNRRGTAIDRETAEKIYHGISEYEIELGIRGADEPIH